MNRSDYLDILIAEGRPEDAEELQRLILEEIDDVLDAYNESLKGSEDFAKKVQGICSGNSPDEEGRSE